MVKNCDKFKFIQLTSQFIILFYKLNDNHNKIEFVTHTQFFKILYSFKKYLVYRFIEKSVTYLKVYYQNKTYSQILYNIKELK